jgi:hypothetical protein
MTVSPMARYARAAELANGEATPEPEHAEVELEREGC